MLKMQMMMAMALTFSAIVSNAQDKYFTKTGKIDFYSKAPLEDIEAKKQDSDGRY